MDGHRLAERRSLAYHRAIAEKLRDEPSILAAARARVAAWRRDGSTHPHYVALWAELLERPTDELATALIDPGEAMTAARQASPFAGSISARERWAIWRSMTTAP